MHAPCPRTPRGEVPLRTPRLPTHAAPFPPRPLPQPLPDSPLPLNRCSPSAIALPRGAAARLPSGDGADPGPWDEKRVLLAEKTPCPAQNAGEKATVVPLRRAGAWTGLPAPRVARSRKRRVVPTHRDGGGAGAAAEAFTPRHGDRAGVVRAPHVSMRGHGAGHTWGASRRGRLSLAERGATGRYGAVAGVQVIASRGKQRRPLRACAARKRASGTSGPAR